MMADSPDFKFEQFEHGDGDVAIFTVCGRTQLNLIGVNTIRQCAEGIQGSQNKSSAALRRSPRCI